MSFNNPGTDGQLTRNYSGGSKLRAINSSQDPSSSSYLSYATQYHAPVMVNKILSYLPPSSPTSTLRIVDLTCGGGGHSEAILRHYTQSCEVGEVVVYGVDQDDDSGRTTGRRLQEWSNNGDRGSAGVAFKSICKNFGDLTTDDLDGYKADFVLGDFGVSSHQIDEEGRGFSYSKEEAPLDMRMDRGRELTAAVICNSWEQEVIRKILVDLGDEEWKVAGKIAASIVESRPLETTGDLCEAIGKVVPKWSKRSPRKGVLKTTSRAFQALRVAVNDEVGVLNSLFSSVLPTITKEGGVVAVLTYQSMEDRIVKTAFQRHWRRGGNIVEIRKEDVGKDIYGNDDVDGVKIWDVVNRGGEKSDKKEIEVNTRARSARLRVAKRSGA